MFRELLTNSGIMAAYEPVWDVVYEPANRWAAVDRMLVALYFAAGDPPGRVPVSSWRFSGGRRWSRVNAMLTTLYAAPRPNVTISGAQSKVEGNSGTTTWTYTVTRSTAYGATAINWTFAAGTTSAADFQGGDLPVGGTVNLANGVAAGTFTITTVGDTVVEPDEVFTVSITAPPGYTLGTPSSATGTILNDDSDTPVDPPVGLDNIPFGANTRRQRGGFVLGPTAAGTYTLTGAAAAAGFTVMTIADENNVNQEMLVIGGTAGNAPPALAGSYAGTITRSGDNQQLPVTVNIIANAWHVRPKWSDTASAFEARTDGFQHASLALGDTIILRAGDYNIGADNGSGSVTSVPGSGHDWYFNRASAPTGVWSGSNYVVIKGEGCPATPYDAYGRPRPIADYPVRIRRLSVTRSGSNIDQYAHFTQLAFYKKLDLAVCPMWVSGMQPALNGYVAYGSRIYQRTGTPSDWTVPPQTAGGVTAGWTGRGVVSATALLNFGQGANGPGKCKLTNVLFAGDNDYAKRHLVDTIRFYGLNATGSGAAGNHAREIVTDNLAFSGMARDITFSGDPTAVTDPLISHGRHVSQHCNGQCLVFTDVFPLRQTGPWVFVDKKVGYRASPWDTTSNVHGDYIYIATTWTTAMGTFEFGTIGMDPTRTTVHGVIAMRGSGTPGDHDGTITMQDNKGTARAQNGLLTNILGVANLVRGPSLWKNDNVTVRRSTFLTDMSPSGVPAGQVGAYMADSANYVVDRCLFSAANGIIEDAALAVTGNFAPANGLNGLDTLAKIAAVIPGAIYGANLAGKTEAEIRAAWAPALNGTAKQGDGTYAGALKPNGAWNDGAVYP